ncbi:MAG: M50 family metallopeptidase [Fimbriimonadales bacterium]|nr:M50 family metallopeptidase [Fimbriimonadales bacterium]MDW8051413.1 M50 family metallopeptidase [Armatimonadota bacterium]
MLLLTIVYLVGMFTLLVAAHELGHMWVAKRFRMKVEEFAIGIGPLLLRLWRGRDGTQYTLRALPLGGFVKIPGMMPDEEHIEGGFQSKPLHARFLTVLAGPLASILFGFVLFVLIGVTAGLPSPDKPLLQVKLVMPDSPAQQAGVRIGDILVSINGIPAKSIEHATELIRANPNRPIVLELRRDGQPVRLTVVPREEEIEEKGVKKRIGRIGVLWHHARQREPIGVAIVHAGYMTVGVVVGVVEGLRRLIFGQGSIHEVGSVISIASAANAMARLGFAEVATFAAQFSIMLGVINLLPIPVLDGGYLLIFAIEAIRRRKLSPESMARVQFAGLVIVLMIFVAVFSLDIYKLLTGKLIR